jgi:hypothetical protein
VFFAQSFMALGCQQWNMEQKHGACEHSIIEIKRNGGNDHVDTIARQDGGTNHILNRIIWKKLGVFNLNVRF